MNDDIISETKKVEDIFKEADLRSCPIQKLLYSLTEFIKDVMCGKCFPCAFGTEEARIISIKLSQYVRGINEKDVDALKRIGFNLVTGSFCKKGKDMGSFILDTVEPFYEEIKKHIVDKCPYEECVNIVNYFINPDLCNKCGECFRICKYYSIIRKKSPYSPDYFSYEIDQTKCIKCGDCIEVCPENAIDVIVNNRNIIEIIGEQ